MAVGVARAGAVPGRDTINARLARSVEEGVISRFALLDDVVLMDALPKTGVGKVDKKALRNILERRERR